MAHVQPKTTGFWSISGPQQSRYTQAEDTSSITSHVIRRRPQKHPQEPPLLAGGWLFSGGAQPAARLCTFWLRAIRDSWTTPLETRRAAIERLLASVYNPERGPGNLLGIPILQQRSSRSLRPRHCWRARNPTPRFPRYDTRATAAHPRPPSHLGAHSLASTLDPCSLGQRHVLPAAVTLYAPLLDRDPRHLRRWLHHRALGPGYTPL